MEMDELPGIGLPTPSPLHKTHFWLCRPAAAAEADALHPDLASRSRKTFPFPTEHEAEMWRKGELPKGPRGEDEHSPVPTATPINPEQMAMPAHCHVAVLHTTCSVMCTRNAINPLHRVQVHNASSSARAAVGVIAECRTRAQSKLLSSCMCCQLPFSMGRSSAALWKCWAVFER